VDRAELTRTTTAMNDERGLGWAATGAKTWAGRQLAATSTHDVCQNGAKGKNARARSVKKNSGVESTHFGFAKSKCKVPWSWTIFRLCK